MKKIQLIMLSLASILFFFPSISHAMDSYTVRPGDSLWKIAVKYKIGLREIINANNQINNPDLIYPNEKIKIPNIDTTKSIEQRVIKLTNIKRQQSGVAPLTANWQLSRVARQKARDMATNGYFSHTSPTYGSPFTMIRNYGISYRTAGENIAKGQRTAQEVVNAWWASPGHRKNMLDPKFTQIGVGKYGNCWSQMFIGK